MIMSQQYSSPVSSTCMLSVYRYIDIIRCFIVFFNNDYTIVLIFIWKIAHFSTQLLFGLLQISCLEDSYSHTGWLLFGYCATEYLADAQFLGHLPSCQSTAAKYVESSDYSSFS